MGNEYNVIVVNENDIPDIIAGQFTQIQALGEKVNEAVEMAEKAQGTAREAHEKSTGLGRKKVAIESLQEAAVDLAQSQISFAESQKVSFEYQQQLGKITQYLFALGTSNIASNRSVVRQLELKLKGASEEELTELARQEVLNVIRQLKAQEDILKKQDKLLSKVKDHEKRIKDQEKKGFDLDDRIDSAERNLQATDKRLSEKEALQDEKFEEYKNQLIEREKKDKEHDKLLRAGKEKDDEQDRHLSEQAEKNLEHDRLLKERELKDVDQDKLIGDLQERIDELEVVVNSLEDSMFDRNFGYISFVMAFIGIILGILHFFA